MPPFSEREGFSKPREVIQVSSLDEETRTMIWNLIHDVTASHTSRFKLWKASGMGNAYATDLGKLIHTEFFKLPRDEADSYISDRIKNLCQSDKWYRLIDFLEFFGHCIDNKLSHIFFSKINKQFEQYSVGYRAVDGRFIRITSGQEVVAIESGLRDAGSNEVRAHLNKAVSFLANRPNPDLENAAKEAVSALEALFKELCGDPKATLADALKAQSITLHPALSKAIGSLYGFAGDFSGVRHSYKDENRLDMPTAQFLVVSASSIVSFVRSLTS